MSDFSLKNKTTVFILRAADLRGCDFYEGCCGNEPRDVFNPLLNGKTVKPFGREGKRLLTSPQTTGRMTDRFYSHICEKKKKGEVFPSLFVSCYGEKTYDKRCC